MNLERVASTSAVLTLTVLFVVGCLLIGRHAPRQRLGLVLLFSACCLPALYAALVWAQWFVDRYVRFERLWLCWLPSAASLAVWAFTLRTDPRDVSLQRFTRDAALSLAALCAGLAVCGVEIAQALRQTALVVVIDQSRSTELVLDVEERVRRELDAARTSMGPEDRMATLVFGADALVESPLLSRDQHAGAAKAPVARGATDIERALRRALAEIPADATGRVVLLSDGVATRGDVSAGIAAAVAAGVRVDVVPLDQRDLPNVRLVKVNTPTSVSLGETYALRVVVESPRAGELTLEVTMDQKLLRRGPVRVQAGQTVLSLTQTADSPGLHRIDVRVFGTEPELDLLQEDNQLASFIRVKGRTRTLVISESESSAVATALGDGGMSIDETNAAGAPKTASAFALYDLVVLEDVPAERLMPSQLEAIADYVSAAGGGLLLMGSANAMGPGGYSLSPIERVSPVSFDLKQDRRRGQLSQVILIDFSGSMAAPVGERSKLDLANEGAVRSMSLMGPGDHLGVAHVDTRAHWSVPLSVIDDRARLAERIRAVGPGGGGILVDPALEAAYTELEGRDSALKHVLVFADGADAEGMERAVSLAQAAQRSRITTSVVALGIGDDLPKLERLSQAGGGRFHLVTDATRLPAVFARETITAAQAALREQSFSVTPEGPYAALRGIDFRTAPPLGGYVVTLEKPRASVLLRGPDADPILSSWSTGLGRVAAFSSDFGGSWGADWAIWPPAAQLFIQLGRSLARSTDDSQIRLDATVRDGQLVIGVDALDQSGALDDYRALAALVAGPDGELDALTLRPSGPGRYGTSLPLTKPGAYLVSVQDGQSQELLATTGVEVGAGDELQATGTDLATLRRIAEESGGKLRENLAGYFDERVEARLVHIDATEAAAWACALLLLASVALRRLQLGRTPALARTPESHAVDEEHAAASPRSSSALRGDRHVESEALASPRPKTTAELLLERRKRRRAAGADHG